MTALTVAQAETSPTLRAAWSDRTAALMAGCCELAYAADVDVLREGLRPGGLSLAGCASVGPDRRAYVAAGERLWVLAFRGTADLADWRIDLDAGRCPLPGVPGVEVHRGFLAAFEALRPALARAIALLPAGMPLYVTGHSLGGALAQIALALLDGDQLAACYTFGSPRVASRAFERRVHAPHYRVVNGWDLIPGVPTPWLSGYRHTGDPRLLTGDGVMAYARDRSLLGRFVVDALGCAGGLVSHKLPPVTDHAIQNYRARLDAIARARTQALDQEDAAHRTINPAVVC